MKTSRCGLTLLALVCFEALVAVPAIETSEECERWPEVNSTQEPSFFEYTYRAGDIIPSDTKPHFEMQITPGKSVAVGEPITFNLSGSHAKGDDVFTTGDNGPIVTWIHDFGDGSQANAPVATHSYGEPGVYFYTNKIHDASGWRWGTKEFIEVGNPPCGRSPQELWIPSGANLMHGWVTMPVGEGPHPLILEYGPYPAIRVDPCDPYVRNGYARAYVEAPGRVLSTGEFDLFGPQTRQGGYDAVEWLAAQPWCDGNVGMMGLSGQAVGAMLTASANPPSLKCVIAISSYADLYRDLVAPGGVFNSDTFTTYWLLLFVPLADALAVGAIDENGDLVPDVAESLIDNTGTFAEMKLHPDFDWFWEERAIVNYPEPSASILYVGNSHDLWPRATTEIQRWIAPGGGKTVQVTGAHASPELSGWFPASGANLFAGVRLQWFDHYLKGKANNIESTLPDVLTLTTRGGDIPAVFNYNVWEELTTLPAPETEPHQFYLRFANNNLERPAHHSLSETPPGILETPAPLNWSPIQGWNAGLMPGHVGKSHLVAMQETWEAHSLVYETPILEEELRVNGPATLTIYASPAFPVEDMSFTVHVSDVWPDDTSHTISQGFLLSSHRALDYDQSLYLGDVLIRPYHSHTSDSEQDWEAGEIYRFDIEIWSIHNIFQPGHRLRISLAAQDFGWRTNFETDLAALVYSDFYKPSVLNLAILPEEKSHDPFPLGVPKDDFKIDMVGATEDDLKTGDLTTLYAEVRNNGETVLPPTVVQFYDGDPDSEGTLLGETITSQLSPGSIEIVNAVWSVKEAGRRRIFAVVDPADEIEEYCEADNQAYSDIFVKLYAYIDDNDHAVEYVGGWHRIQDEDASQGAYHWRFSNGSKLRTTRLSFTGHQITYHYARSTRGGTANLYLDGEFHSTVDYFDPNSKNPIFGHQIVIPDLAEGAHELLIVHGNRGVYIDGFEVISGQPDGGADSQAARSGTDTQVYQTQIGGPLRSTASFPVAIGENVSEISVLVEGADHPLTVQIVGPLGDVLATGDLVVGDVLDISGVEQSLASVGEYMVLISDPTGPAEDVEVYITRQHNHD